MVIDELHKINLDIFRREIGVLVTSNWIDAVNILLDGKEIDRNEADELLNYPSKLGNFEGLTFTLENGRDIIWIQLTSDTNRLLELLVHESTHMMFRTLQAIDIKYHSKNEEIFSYLLGYIVSESIKFLDLNIIDSNQ